MLDGGKLRVFSLLHFVPQNFQWIIATLRDDLIKPFEKQIFKIYIKIHLFLQLLLAPKG